MGDKSYGHVEEGDALTDGQKEFLLDTEGGIKGCHRVRPEVVHRQDRG